MEKASRKRKTVSAEAEKLSRCEQELETLRSQVAGFTKRSTRFAALLHSTGETQQLLFQESDRARIIQNLCDLLVEKKYYAQAWIMLLDAGGQPEKTAQAGFPDALEKITRPREEGGWARCLQVARERAAVVAIMDPAFSCGPCSLSAVCQRHGWLVANIGYGHRVFGVLAVAVPRTSLAHEEEKNALRLLANSLGAAFFRQEFEPGSETSQALAREQALLRSALNALPTPLAIRDENGQTLWSNPAAARRKSPTELPGAGETQSWWLTQTRPYPGPDAANAGTVEIAWDAAEQKTVEKNLQELLTRFRNIFISSPSALCLVDHQGQIAEVNRSMCELFGLVDETAVKQLNLLDYFKLSEQNQAALRAHRIVHLEGAYDPAAFQGNRAFKPQQTGVMQLEILISAFAWNSDSQTPGYLVQMQDITDRKNAEDALCQSEEKYRTIFEHSGTALAIVNDNLTLSLINREMVNLSGYTSQEILEAGKWFQIIFPEDQEKLKLYHASRRTNPDSAPRAYEIRFQHKNGEIRTALLSATLIPSAGQSLAAIVDITERKHTEEALRLSEEKYRATFENSGNALALLEDDLTISLVNLEMETLLGISRAELEGKRKWPEFLSRSETLAGFADYHRLRRQDPAAKAISLESSIARRGAAPRDVMLALTSLPASHQFLLTLADITERKTSERNLQESEQRYRLLADNIHDVIWMADAGHHLTFITPSVMRLRGFMAEEALSQSLEESFTPESVQRMRDWNTSALSKTHKKGWNHPLELEQFRKDGSTVWTEVHISPLQDAQGRLTGYVGMTRDISPRLQAEAEQRRLEEQLRQSQKMEVIGHLAGGIAHDFNNLLTPILGYADMAASQVPAGIPLANDIQAIQEAAERAARLTRQLLAFSLKQVLHITTVQLNREIMDFIKMLHSLIGENILVRTELAPDLGCIKADLTQVQQVLMNLAVNARDAMPRGGTLTLSTANVTVDEVLIKKHPALNAGVHVRLTVADTGTGMTPKILGQIFEPFFTTKESGKGTGLGLSMVYGIVTQHMGAIVAESEPGKGSTFNVYFPLAPGIPSPIEPALLPEAYQGGRETIMVVEDEPMVLKLAQEFLSVQGYTVMEAADPLQALEYLRGYAGSIDLLLTDIIMPGMNGKELYQHLAGERPGLKVLYMSGYSEDVIAHQGVLEPGVQLLSKPFALKTLLAKVRAVLDQPVSIAAAT